MNRIFVAGLLFLSTATAAPAQFRYFQWGGTLHGTGDDIVSAIAPNPANGNLYVVGHTFSPSVDFDLFENEGGLSLSGDATNGKAFISVFNGNIKSSQVLFNWFISNGLQRGNSIAVDSGGNFYVAGRFGGHACFAPLPVEKCGTAVGPSDLYLVKIDSSGNFFWVDIFTGSSIEMLSGQSLALDESGNVFLGGQFGASTDATAATFNPNPSSSTGQMTAPAAGQSSGFIIKLDTNGNYQTSAQITGTCNNAIDGSRLALDGAGNVIFAAESGFGGCNANQATSVVIVKTDAMFNFQWVKTITTTTAPALDLYSIAASSFDDSIAIAGSFTGTVSLYVGQGGATYASGGAAGNANGFLLRLNSDGGYRTSGTFTGSGNSRIDGLAFDSAGRLYFSGTYNNNYIDPTAPNSHSAVAAVSTNAAVGEIEANGNLGWVDSVQSLTANCSVDAYDLVPIARNAMIVAGNFDCGQINLDFGATPQIFNSAGGVDSFIMQSLQETIFSDGFE